MTGLGVFKRRSVLSLTLHLHDMCLYNVTVVFVLTCVVADVTQAQVADVERTIVKHLKQSGRVTVN